MIHNLFCTASGISFSDTLPDFDVTSPTGMIFNEQDQEVRDMGYHKHAFNVLISNRLGYHRDLPDTRNDKSVCVFVCL